MHLGGLDDDELPLLVVAQTSPLWIGTPALHSALTAQEEGDAFFSKVGGLPALFRAIDRDSECPIMRCPSCSKTSSVRLVCQLYAPIESTSMDRVLYILQCEKCSAKERAMLFVFRSSSYNPELGAAVTVAAPTAAVQPTVPLFEETDDWGDDDGNGATTINVAAGVAVATVPEVALGTVPSATPTADPPRAVHQIAPIGVVPPNASTKNVLRCFGLELFVDNDTAAGGASRGRHGGKHATAASERLAEDQLMDIERACGAEAVDRTSIEHDDETPEERCSRQFMECVGCHPAQCVRWHLGAPPVVCRLDEPPPPIPPCDHCGAPRRFECQLMSPLIYFATKGCEEARHSLHYGVVLVYSCTADCDALPYNKEYCFVQSEI